MIGKWQNYMKKEPESLDRPIRRVERVLVIEGQLLVQVWKLVYITSIWARSIVKIWFNTRFYQKCIFRHHLLGGWSSVASTSHLNTSLASNIQKMFNEKIEVFSPVEFSKVSILTGIVKIGLKTLLECVRLRTFSR